MPILIGGLLVVSGSLIVYGAITGRLASMIGGLFGINVSSSGGNTGISLPNAGPNPLTPAIGGAHKGKDGKCHLLGLDWMPSIPCPPGL